MSDPRVRNLKIKTGVVKRITKEKLTYEKEAEIQRGRIQKLKDQGEEEQMIKKQYEVLDESVAMVPDCQRRLVKAFNELKTLLEKEEDLKETEEYVTALTIIEEAKLQLPQ